VADLHLNGSAAGNKEGIETDVPGNLDGILEVSLDLIQDVLGSSAQEDGASLGFLALLDEGEIFIADFADLIRC
jgi:hypothetical protein